MYIKIENTFDFYLYVFNKKGLFKYFPELEKDLNSQYNELISNQLNLSINLIEEFYFNVLTGIRNESYDIYWSIPKAQQLIKKSNTRYSLIDINQIYSDASNLEPNKLKYYESKDVTAFDPIIVSYYLPINQLIVIDGNHRVYWSNMKKKKDIKAYILNPILNLKIMSERNYKLYAFHHNLVNLLSLCCNYQEWKFESNKKLNWNSYYGDVRFNNLIFKKLKLIINKPHLQKANRASFNSKTNGNLHYH